MDVSCAATSHHAVSISPVLRVSLDHDDLVSQLTGCVFTGSDSAQRASSSSSTL